MAESVTGPAEGADLPIIPVHGPSDLLVALACVALLAVALVFLRTKARRSTRALRGEIRFRREVEREMKIRLGHQHLLTRLGERALGGLSLPALQEQVAQAAAYGLEVEFAKVLEIDPARNVMVLRAGVGWETDLVGRMELEVGSGSHCGYALRRGQPVVLEDLRGETRFTASPWLQDRGIRSGISVAIPGPDRPYGVLAVHARDARRFSVRDVGFLEALALLLGHAMERARIQEALEQRATQLRDANDALCENGRLRDEFFANASHELRTPLTLILSPLESVLSGMVGEIPEAARGALQTAHRNAMRLLHIATQILDVERLRAGQVVSQRVPTDLGNLTARVVDEFRPAAESRRVRLSWSEPAATMSLLVDRYLVERILFNLLSNAVKFTPAGGEIRVVLESRGDGVRLEVRDTGPGIPPESLPMLFRRFQRVRNPGAPETEGAGLGLAMVRDFARLLGGDVEVDSRPGAGSVFAVTFPAQPVASPVEPEPQQARRPYLAGPEAVPPPPPEGSHGAAADATVLVVEDNLELARHVASLLEGHCAVRIAASGEEALRSLADAPPDLVLADVMMPGMDGLALCRRIKSDPATAEIPVVLLTAVADRATLLRGWEAGADEYLLKPFHPAELVTRIRTLLGALRRRRRIEADRDALRRELLEGQKMQAIGRLVAGVAHEINNPTGYVLSNLETLQGYHATLVRFASALGEWVASAPAEGGGAALRERFESLRGEAELDYLLRDMGDALRDSREGGEKVRDIVRSLMGFAGTDARRPRSVDLHEVLEASLRVCWNEIKYKAEVRREYGEIPAVWCQPNRIQQVFVNLLVNAAQAIERRGTIRVSTGRDGAGIVVRVADDGAGIRPEHRDRIFEPFFTTRPVGQGSGLGLHVASGIVRAHGGRMTFRSAPGEGTEFSVFLPVGEPAASAPDAAPVDEVSSRTGGGVVPAVP